VTLRWPTAMIVIALLALTGCRDYGKPDVSGAPQTYCEALGYTLQTRDNADGSKTTVCVFPDGSECEETAFLQGDCGLQYTYCAQHSYLPERRLDSENNGTSYVVCHFPDGSICTDFDYAFDPYKCNLTRVTKSCEQQPGGLCDPPLLLPRPTAPPGSLYVPPGS
jgi:putative hemolysin